MFRVAPKTVYRTMKGENKGPVKDMPEKEKVEGFWGGFWSTATHYKQDAPWLHTLHNEYAADAQQKEYEITDEILEKVLSKMTNDKPGKDLTTSIWIKSLRSTNLVLRAICVPARDEPHHTKYLLAVKPFAERQQMPWGRG